jgi:hypothetical protein
MSSSFTLRAGEETGAEGAVEFPTDWIFVSCVSPVLPITSDSGKRVSSSSLSNDEKMQWSGN